MTPLDLVRLTPLMERTSGSPEVTIGLIDGPVVMQHPDLAASPPRASRKTGAVLHPGQQRRVPARHLCRGDLVRQAGNGGSGDLSRLHPAGAAHLCRDDSGERRDAERHARRTRPGHSRLYRRGCSRAERQRRPRPTLHQERAGVGRGFGPGRPARGDRDRGGGQSGDARQHCHHRPPVGHPGRGVTTCKAGPWITRTWEARLAGGDWAPPATELPASARKASR